MSLEGHACSEKLLHVEVTLRNIREKISHILIGVIALTQCGFDLFIRSDLVQDCLF
jgi:hypothetical protein